MSGVLLAALVSACEVQSNVSRTRNPDGGPDSSVTQGTGGAATSTGGSTSSDMDSATGGASSGGSSGKSQLCDGAALEPRDAAPVTACRAVPDTTSDAADGDAGDVADGDDGDVADGDAGSDTPPEHCIPPCVWKLMKHCRPQGACSWQSYPGGIFGPNSVSCVPSSRWWRITTLGHIGYSDHFYIDGCRCYGYHASLMGTTGGAWSQTFEEWYDGDGNSIAWGVVTSNSLTGGVICGPFNPSNPSGPAYEMDPFAPDCAPWLGPDCSEGCCPPNPPEVPVSAF